VSARTKRARKPHFADPRRARIGRMLTLGGYFGLLALILNWFAWIAPPERIPRAFPMIALAVPLLFPLRGLLHGRRYTHLWAGFLSMAYLAIGIDAWLNAARGGGWLGATMAVLATSLFVGTVVYARYTSSGTSAAARAEADAEARLNAANAAATDGTVDTSGDPAGTIGSTGPGGTTGTGVR